MIIKSNRYDSKALWIGSTEYVGNKGKNSSPFKAVSKKKIKANFLLDYDRNFTQYIIEAKSHHP